MSDNLDLWNRVGKTNPAHTKKVSFGRAITAIDPYRQIEAATKEFGPVGVGWGYKVASTHFLPTQEVVVIIEMWTGDKENTFCHSGQNSMYMDAAHTKVDKDCMKKSITDGITKCLSILGFNNDIFLGKFDDSKYVQERQMEEAEKAKPPRRKSSGDLTITAMQQKFRDLASELSECEDVAQIEGMLPDYEATLKQGEVDLSDWHDGAIKAIDKRKTELKDK